MGVAGTPSTPNDVTVFPSATGNPEQGDILVTYAADAS